MMYHCCDALRRETTRASALNGIDFLEVVDNAAPIEADRQRFLHVHLLKDPSPVVYAADRVTITRPDSAIDVLSVQTGLGPQTNIIVVELVSPGDFEPYVLAFRRGLIDPRPPAELDPQLAAIRFSFKVECPSDFDCLASCGCVEEIRPLPEISYLARDYDSFRSLMLHRLRTLQPAFGEPHVADQRMVLVEALAAAADSMSYAQDAAHSEGYLATLQHRVSSRRLGMLVDYSMDEGANARTFVHLEAGGDALPQAPDFAPVVPVGTAFTTRLAGHQVVLPDDPELLASAQIVYEALLPLEAIFVDLNTLDFYTWSDQRCCLPAGGTAATLAGHHPNLALGQFLAFEELMSPRTGSDADRDRSNRPVVRLTAVTAFESPGVPLFDPVTGDEITEIEWDRSDALSRPLCLSAETDEEFGRLFLPRVSVAHGNVVLADHGRTVADEDLGTVPGATASWAPGQGPQALAEAAIRPVACTDEICERADVERIPASFRPRLAAEPLTFAPAVVADASAHNLLVAPGRPQPVIRLVGELDGLEEPFDARRDLLGSGPAAHDFVPEIEDDSAARLRFGDDVNGLRPNSGTRFVATYRVGLGALGNIGEDRLVHVRSDLPIAAVRNMTPGVGGRRPETISEMRRRAPFAFRRQERAVTRADHDEMAARFLPPEGPMQGTVTSIMHTGSWLTSLVTADRRNGLPVDQEFEAALRGHLEHYRMAGRDLEVDDPIHVPIEIDMEVCVCPGHLRAHVKSALLARFSNQVLPDGTLGAFHPDRRSFRETLYLSPLIALAQSVEGVTSVTVTRFRRFSDPDSSGLDEQKLSFGRREIPQLDNDPSHPGHGVLRLRMR